MTANLNYEAKCSETAPRPHSTHPFISNAKRTEALIDYEPVGESAASQLKLSKGDVVWVLEQHDSGWWGGHKDGDEMQGWFPAGAVRSTGRASEDTDASEEHRFNFERCPTTFMDPAAESALFTSNHRAVASPQAASRWRSSPQDEKGLEQELAAERRRVEELQKALAVAEASLQQLSEDGAAQLEERRDLERRLHELEAERQDLELEGHRLKDRLQQAEAELGHMKGQMRTLESQRSVSASMLSCRNSRPEEPSILAETSRCQTSSLPTRLFQQCDGARTPPAPPANTGMAPSMSPSATSMATMPLSPPSMANTASMPTTVQAARVEVPISTAQTMPLSARPAGAAAAMGQPPRPSPRGPPTAPGSWTDASWGSPAARRAPSSGTAPTTMGSQPPSPTMQSRMRQVLPASGKDPQVRALVSEFERRSNSQSALSRTEQTTTSLPTRAVVQTAAVSSSAGSLQLTTLTATALGHTHYRTTGSSSRTGSREAPSQMSSRRTLDHQHGEHEVSRMPPMAPVSMSLGEDQHHGATMTFGMSPLTRQVQYGTRSGVASLSPSARNVSVQERVRQLNGGRR